MDFARTVSRFCLLRSHNPSDQSALAWSPSANVLIVRPLSRFLRPGQMAFDGDNKMTHAQETLKRWQEICRVQRVYEQWREFFTALIGEEEAAEKLCALGLRIVRGELPANTRIQDRVEEILRSIPAREGEPSSN